MANKINIKEKEKEIEDLNAEYKSNLYDFQDIYKKYLVIIEKTKVGEDVSLPDSVNTNLNNIENKLINNRKAFLNIKKNIQISINKLSNEIEKKNEELDILEKKNEDLKRKIFLLTDRKQGSDGMIYDQKELYNQHNLGNWIIIILMVGLFYKVVKPQFTSENMNEIKTRGTSAMEALKM